MVPGRKRVTLSLAMWIVCAMGVRRVKKNCARQIPSSSPRSTILLEPFRVLQIRCTAWMFSCLSSRADPPIFLGSRWSTVESPNVNGLWQSGQIFCCCSHATRFRRRYSSIPFLQSSLQTSLPSGERNTPSSQRNFGTALIWFGLGIASAIFFVLRGSGRLLRSGVLRLIGPLRFIVWVERACVCEPLQVDR